MDVFGTVVSHITNTCIVLYVCEDLDEIIEVIEDVKDNWNCRLEYELDEVDEE